MVPEETGEAKGGTGTTMTQPLSSCSGPEDCACETNKRVPPPLEGCGGGVPQERAGCQVRQGGEGGDGCRERLTF